MNEQTEQTVFEIFKELGVIITDSHFVYTSGRHGSLYIDKDRAYPHVLKISSLCSMIAKRFSASGIQVVVGPEKGAIILSQWVAYHLSIMTSQEVLAFYAEKTKEGGFILNRGGAREIIPGKKVLVVEDIVNTAGSVRKVIEEVQRIRGMVVGLGVLCNRGGVELDDMVNFSLLSADSIRDKVDLETWLPGECKLCERGVPVNVGVGKGKEYVAQREKS